MNVSYVPYSLEFKAFNAKHLNAEGVLLSFEKSGRTSYSLYHPIESLGDVSVNDFLKNFETLVLNSGPLKRVVDLALFDDESLNLEVSCYELCASFSEAEESKSELVKLKTPNVDEVISNLGSKIEKKYILDANGQWGVEDIKSLLGKVPKDSIKYLEDPVKDLEFSSDFSVASDFLSYNSYDYKVLKPTGFNHSLDNPLSKPVVITSYLDHPLGQLISALYAKNNNVSEACGLMTHLLFEKNSYSELFSFCGNFKFSDSKEFFNLLKAEKWSLLK